MNGVHPTQYPSPPHPRLLPIEKTVIIGACRWQRLDGFPLSLIWCNFFWATEMAEASECWLNFRLNVLNCVHNYFPLNERSTRVPCYIEQRFRSKLWIYSAARRINLDKNIWGGEKNGLNRNKVMIFVILYYCTGLFKFSFFQIEIICVLISMKKYLLWF